MSRVLLSASLAAFFTFSQSGCGPKRPPPLEPPPEPAPPCANPADSPETATKERPFANSLGMEFAPVPITGGPTDGKLILFCLRETRNRDYLAFVEAPDRNYEVRGRHDRMLMQEEDRVTLEEENRERAQMADHPAVYVSWDDTQAFCAWLSRREGWTYRLPTDHEWSCAAGIGSLEDPEASPERKARGVPDVYPWGGGFADGSMRGNYAGEEAQEGEWGANHFIKGYWDGFPGTAPTGSFPANEYGLYDLGGNVWERCQDRFNWKRYSESGHVLLLGVRRGGGSGDSNPEALLTSERTPDPLSKDHRTGFRVVLEPGPPDPPNNFLKIPPPARVAETGPE